MPSVNAIAEILSEILLLSIKLSDFFFLSISPVWNSLLLHVRSKTTLSAVTSQLKMKWSLLQTLSVKTLPPLPPPPPPNTTTNTTTTTHTHTLTNSNTFTGSHTTPAPTHTLCFYHSSHTTQNVQHAHHNSLVLLSPI